MRSGDAVRRDTLRLAQNALYAVEKRERRSLTDDDAVMILRSWVRPGDLVLTLGAGDVDRAGRALLEAL